MKVGDMVKIIGGSYAIKVSGDFNISCSIGLAQEDFEILGFTGSHQDYMINGERVHDVFIKSTETGLVYLHTKSLIRFCKRFCSCCGQVVNN